jgi:DNA primase
MSGVHFAEVRARVAMADVLDLIGFTPCESSGAQVRGPCPVHHSASPSSRSFSANLNFHIYKCFKCGSGGNQLDLYAAVTGLSLFEAAIALCEQLHHEVPWVLKESSPWSQPAGRRTRPRRSAFKPGGQAGSSPHRP